MKFTKRITGLLMLLLVCSSLSAQKIGYINSAELLPMMSEYKSAETSMETYQKQKKALLDGKYQTFQTAYQAFMENRQKGIMSPVDEQTQAADIQKMETEIAQMEQEIQLDIARKQEELLVPIQEKAMQAIKDVAAEQGYTYVLDASAGQLLVSPDGDNLIDAPMLFISFCQTSKSFILAIPHTYPTAINLQKRYKVIVKELPIFYWKRNARR